MTLAAISGIPLDRRPEVDLSEKGERLDAHRVRQKGDNWCWAASIESARRTSGNADRKQHQIAADHLCCGSALCELYPRHKDCDKRVQWNDLECLWRKEGFGQARHQQQPISFDELKQEIKARRLVLLEISNQHVILAYGWEVDPQGVAIVHLLDTAPTEQVWSNYKDLLLGYGEYGPWTGTCWPLVFDGSESC